MDIQYVFEKLFENRITLSQVQFSEVWLGRSPRYYSHLIAIQGQQGLATLVALEWRLRGRAAIMPEPSASVLTGLAQRLRLHIEARSILDVRRQRNANKPRTISLSRLRGCPSSSFSLGRGLPKR